MIIEDLMKVGPARLRSLDWRMAEILKSLVGAVRSIRPISKCKIVAGCDSSLQQSRLVEKTNKGQVEVRCIIPQPTVQGVVTGIPRYVQMDEFLKRIEWVSDSGGQTHSKGKVKGASRLTFKDGTASEAIRVTFIAQKLPLLMKINKQEYNVRPYVAEVLRCYKCHRYGHTRVQVKAGGLQNVWPPGLLNLRVQVSTKKMSELRGEGGGGGGEHSAGYKDCRVRKQWEIANKLRAESYLPRVLPSNRLRSWLVPRCKRHRAHLQKESNPCPLSLSLQPGGLTPCWSPGGATPPWWHQGQLQNLEVRGRQKKGLSQLPDPGRGRRGKSRSRKARRSASSMP